VSNPYTFTCSVTCFRKSSPGIPKYNVQYSINCQVRYNQDSEFAQFHPTSRRYGSKRRHETITQYSIRLCDRGRETPIYAEGIERLNDHCSIDAYSFVGGRARRELALGDDVALVQPHEQPRLRRRRLHLNPNSTITKRKLPIRY